MAKKGFTLVELSIVLVIIGLLIGGILVAQSMIATARMNSTIKQLSQFDIAVSNFKTKFNDLPGDTARLAGASGNGNGLIESTESAPSHSVFDKEVADFWKNLSETGFKTETGAAYSNVATTGVRVKVNVPQSSLGNKFTGVGIRPGVDLNKVGNYYELADYDNNTTDADSYGNLGDSFNTGITPVEALNLDKKSDDGVSDTGNIFSTGSANSCHAFGTYDLTNKNGDCKLEIKMNTY